MQKKKCFREDGLTDGFLTELSEFLTELNACFSVGFDGF